MTNQISDLSYNIKALILDMDGVVWRGSDPIGDLPSIFNTIDSLGLKVLFATNNSTLTVSSYLDKLSSVGLQMEAEQVITSAEATASYLTTIIPNGSNIYIIGEDGLVETLEHHGFVLTEEKVAAVVVGLDREFSYQKIATGMRLVEAGARLIGTNPDVTLPQPGEWIPGAGAMIAAMEACTGNIAQIIGKPSPEMFSQALKRLGTTPEETLVVGDRLETDIAGGQAGGCLTALVLSGASTENQAAEWIPAPSIIAANLEELVEQIREKPV